MAIVYAYLVVMTAALLLVSVNSMNWTDIGS